MKRSLIVVTSVFACALGFAARSVFPADAPPAPAAPPAAPSAEDPMMEAMMRLAKPGPEHARLAKALVGTWNVHGSFHMGGQTMQSDAVATIESIFGGRYLTQEVKGDAPWGPVEGRGLLGYNNGTRQFVSIWIDNMGTGIMSGTGTEDPEEKGWTFQSSYDAGEFKLTTREVTRVVGPDEWTVSMYNQEGDQEVLGMELVYKRKK